MNTVTSGGFCKICVFAEFRVNSRVFPAYIASENTFPDIFRLYTILFLNHVTFQQPYIFDNLPLPDTMDLVAVGLF